MANIASAKKRARQSEMRRQQNAAQRSMLRSSIKKVLSAVKAGKKDEAVAAYQAAMPMIDKMAGKGIIHKNKAARHKSRLSADIKSMS